MNSTKPGHQLEDIQEFGAEELDKLREQLSVTTAEEFLYFSTHFKNEIARLLEVNPEAVDHFAKAATSVVDEDEVAAIRTEAEETYPYRTGHDLPSDTNGTFWEG